MPRLRAIGIAALAALLTPALFALDTQNAEPEANAAVPGTMNYVEGAVTINGQFLNQQAVGSAVVEPGQVLATTNGRAEMLLTPGVYLRLGHDSAVRMQSPDLTNTVVDMEHGHADVEVDQLYQQNDIHVLEDNVPVQLVKTGLYEFNANRGTMMVFDGEAAALKPDEKFVTVKKGHELNVADVATSKPAKFDEASLEQTGLYRWSSLRSDYLAEANQQMAGYYGYGYGPGWYWDPWMFDYTFLGPYGFYSPFGWGFYPMGGWGWGGFYGGYGPGFYGHNGHLGKSILRGRQMMGDRGVDNAGHADGFRGGAFRSGGEMGGFGGFHGGGGFGGFHGGGGFGHGR